MNDDYRKVTQPKVDNIFSEPNELDELLEDLNDYESFMNTDNLFNSDKMDRLVVEKHKPYEDAEKVKIDKKADFVNEKQLRDEHRDIYDKKNYENDLLTDIKELDELLESEDAYKKYLGIE